MNGWTVCLKKLASLDFLKKVLEWFFMKKFIFLRKTYLASSFFVVILSFFISIVFFLVRLSMLMIYLSWALCYANKIGSNSWGHSESTYALMEGRGGTPKTSENVQGEGCLPKVYDKIYSFEGVFSHLKCLFLFWSCFKNSNTLKSCSLYSCSFDSPKISRHQLLEMQCSNAVWL